MENIEDDVRFLSSSFERGMVEFIWFRIIGGIEFFLDDLKKV